MVRGLAKRTAVPAPLRSSWMVRSAALPRPTRSRRWAASPAGAWSRRVSPRPALNSPDARTVAAALVMTSFGVRSAGAGLASLPEVVLVSTAKTARSGVAKVAGDCVEREVFIDSMVTRREGGRRCPAKHISIPVRKPRAAWVGEDLCRSFALSTPANKSVRREPRFALRMTPQNY